MKLFDLTVGLIGITGCTIILLIASVLIYIGSLGMIIYTSIRRKTKFASSVKKLNALFNKNVKAYYQTYIGAK